MRGVPRNAPGIPETAMSLMQMTELLENLKTELENAENFVEFKRFVDSSNPKPIAVVFLPVEPTDSDSFLVY